MKKYIITTLRGVGQVFLQNNALTGLIFLAGIFYNSWIFGLGAILGNIISTFSAKIFKYSKEDVENGLYGFNGTLVGIATFYFFGFNFITILAVLFGSILSSVIMHYINKKIPAFTAPFVISTWVIIFIITFLNISSIITSPFIQSNSFNLFSSVSKGFGQVMFQENIITGMLFFIGILINSRISALFAFYGSLIGSLFAILISLPISSINIGLFGYNAVLCAIALGDNNKKKTFIFVTFAIILSVLINFGFNKIGIISLTAPFVLATWIIIFIKNKLQKNTINNI
jgi:urea transporter